MEILKWLEDNFSKIVRKNEQEVNLSDSQIETIKICEKNNNIVIKSVRVSGETTLMMSYFYGKALLAKTPIQILLLINSVNELRDLKTLITQYIRRTNNQNEILSCNNREIKFKNGSKIIFSRDYHGINYDILYIGESIYLKSDKYKSFLETLEYNNNNNKIISHSGNPFNKDYVSAFLYELNNNGSYR